MFSLSELAKSKRRVSRSISPENPAGLKGGGGMATTGTCAGYARELGRGWKVNPYIRVAAGDCVEIAKISGSGAIKSIWCTGQIGRHFILRVYWDDSDRPAIECPLADFFASPWTSERWGINLNLNCHIPVNSLPVAVNPVSGFNCYWEMPFARNCRMTVENRSCEQKMLFYQINYELFEHDDPIQYFHAHFQRRNPLPYGDVYTILDNKNADGKLVGIAMGWGVNNNGWWGEGEVKFYIDGDEEFPTICGTGTEDYFGGSYCWEINDQYQPYSAAFCGMQVVPRNEMPVWWQKKLQSQQRFQMYRWHVTDPVYFQENLRVTIQALGFREDNRYLPLQDDICSVAFWYQTTPAATLPPIPDKDYCEIN